jgi:hypothetical protein
MTSFAFILGVIPLAIATGAGAEMRQSLGTAVFFGMLGVTGFGSIIKLGVRSWKRVLLLGGPLFQSLKRSLARFVAELWRTHRWNNFSLI